MKHTHSTINFSTSVYAFLLLTWLATTANAQKTITGWHLNNDGTANYQAAETNAIIPAGCEVRIKIVSVGEIANLYVDGNGKLGSWPENRLVKDQVLKLKLSSPQKIKITVGGANYWHKATSVTVSEDSDRITFTNGWIVDVKVIGEQF